MMKEFDDKLTSRRFDNFQFVNFTEITTHFGIENPELEFAKRALMEVPAQFKLCRQLGLFNSLPPAAR